MKLFTKIPFCVYWAFWVAGIVLGVVSVSLGYYLTSAVSFLLSLVMSSVIHSTAKVEKFRMQLYNDKFVLEKAKVDSCKRKISLKEFLAKMKVMESVIESDIHYVEDARKKLEEM